MTQKKRGRRPAEKEFDDAIKEVRDFYRLGCILYRRHSKRAKWRDKAMEDEANSREQSSQMMRLARQFARYYRPEELDELLALAEETGFPFRKSHVIHLLRVPIAKDRQRLQRQVINDEWSTTKLGRYVTAHYAKRGGAGRSQSVAKNALELLSQLEAMCDTWMRLKGQMKMKLLPEPIKKQFKHVVEAIDTLETKVGNEIMRRKRTRLARRVGRSTVEKNREKNP